MTCPAYNSAAGIVAFALGSTVVAYDAKTGKEVWTAKYATRPHTGLVPFKDMAADGLCTTPI